MISLKQLTIISLMGASWFSQAQEVLLTDANVRVLLEPKIETQLMSPIVGQVVKLNAQLGQAVRHNEELIRFNCDEPQAKLAIAKAELASAQINLDAKQRLQKLQQAGDIEVKLAANAVQGANAQLTLAQAHVEQCSIKAPFNGFIVSIQTAPYQGVVQSDPLLILVSDESPKIRFNAPANWVGWLAKKQDFQVQVDELGEVFDAQISAINARLDPVSQTLEVEGSFKKPSQMLLPGMSGTASFSGRTQ
ncbi:efflux RND transporter periplasmic adaptor subunit [Marinomonas fungiae]|uniref:efflux RND transporter periplasmic adaptor subunit n=1 Tax=Marinomonas fungiae TaxID=1137284 RepID=UPI003A94F4BE